MKLDVLLLRLSAFFRQVTSLWETRAQLLSPRVSRLGPLVHSAAEALIVDRSRTTGGDYFHTLDYFTKEVYAYVSLYSTPWRLVGMHSHIICARAAAGRIQWRR